MSFASLFFFSETFPNHKPTMNNADDNLNDHHHQDQLWQSYYGDSGQAGQGSCTERIVQILLQ